MTERKGSHRNKRSRRRRNRLEASEAQKKPIWVLGNAFGSVVEDMAAPNEIGATVKGAAAAPELRLRLPDVGKAVRVGF